MPELDGEVEYVGGGHGDDEDVLRKALASFVEGSPSLERVVRVLASIQQNVQSSLAEDPQGTCVASVVSAMRGKSSTHAPFASHLPRTDIPNGGSTPKRRIGAVGARQHNRVPPGPMGSRSGDPDNLIRLAFRAALVTCGYLLEIDSRDTHMTNGTKFLPLVARGSADAGRLETSELTAFVFQIGESSSADTKLLALTGFVSACCIIQGTSRYPSIRARAASIIGSTLSSEARH